MSAPPPPTTVQRMQQPDSPALQRLLDPRVVAPLLLCASVLICLWYLPYGLPSPDAGAGLVHAARIAEGAVFYRDLDAYPFPAASYLLAAVMRLFGENLMVARTAAAVVFTAIVLAGYRITLALGSRGSATLCGLAVLSLRFLAWPAFQDFLYAELALAFALWAVVAWLRFQRSGERLVLAVAGLLLGMTLLSKQNLGIYLAAVVGLLLLARGRRSGRDFQATARDVATLGIAFAAPLVMAAVHFWQHGVLGRMLYSGLLRPFSGYLPTSGVPFSVPLQWWNFGELQGSAGFPYSVGPLFEMLGMKKLPLLSWYPVFWTVEEALVRLLYTAIPLVFVAAGLEALRHRRQPAGNTDESGDSILPLALMALAVLASAFPRADYYHIVSVVPALLPLAFVAGSRLVSAWRPGPLQSAARLAAAGATVSVFVATLVLAGWYFRGLTFEAGNERGRVYVYPENAWVEDVVAYLDANLEDDDGLFVYGHEAYYYFWSDRYASWPFVQLYPGMTGEDGGRQLVSRLEAAPPAIVVKGLIGGWPGLPDVRSYAGELSAYIDANYSSTGRPFSDGVGPDATAPPAWLFEVLERRPPQP